ncbi:DinB family protein [Saccharomonospora saliphila]|uniref:DinB family protein n=1 Tax=Saccharomonospora saliphila TaxID=369829 RepID=UPI00036AA180|nr:DinB family protein [Saccharomonospora saliphila]
MDDLQRNEPSHLADERTTLAEFLQYQRDTLAVKCAGLTTEQLKQRAVPPSALSLLGLVRHMAEVERIWFRNVLNGENSPHRWLRDTGEFGDFDVDDADCGEAFELWRMECARAHELANAAESLDIVGHQRDVPYSLRWILTHMIEEYARHNGHADLLRERIDGATGE